MCRCRRIRQQLPFRCSSRPSRVEAPQRRSAPLNASDRSLWSRLTGMGKEKAENTAKTTHNGADNEGGERRAQREREGDDDVRPSGPPSCIDRRVCAPWGAGEE